MNLETITGVLISEVSPCDGLQSIKGILSTADMIRLFTASLPGEPGETVYGVTADVGLPKGWALAEVARA